VIDAVMNVFNHIYDYCKEEDPEGDYLLNWEGKLEMASIIIGWFPNLPLENKGLFDKCYRVLTFLAVLDDICGQQILDHMHQEHENFHSKSNQMSLSIHKMMSKGEVALEDVIVYYQSLREICEALPENASARQISNCVDLLIWSLIEFPNVGNHVKFSRHLDDVTKTLGKLYNENNTNLTTNEVFKSFLISLFEKESTRAKFSNHNFLILCHYFFDRMREAFSEKEVEFITDKCCTLFTEIINTLKNEKQPSAQQLQTLINVLGLVAVACTVEEVKNQFNQKIGQELDLLFEIVSTISTHEEKELVIRITELTTSIQENI